MVVVLCSLSRVLVSRSIITSMYFIVPAVGASRLICSDVESYLTTILFLKILLLFPSVVVN